MNTKNNSKIFLIFGLKGGSTKQKDKEMFELKEQNEKLVQEMKEKDDKFAREMMEMRKM